MKTDRELLMFAAKAAGFEYRRDINGEVLEYFGGGLSFAEHGDKWNPLTDDGDALRLAVKLGIDVSRAQLDYYDKHSNNQYTATRRAIVRAAAEIGASL